MKVKELIQELIEYDMDSQVEIVIGDDEICEFDLEEIGSYSKYLQFKVDTKGKTLINDKDLEKMEDEIDSIENYKKRIEDLESEVESLENFINEK